MDNINTKAPVDALLPLTEKWREDADLAENSRKVDELFGTKWQPRTAGVPTPEPKDGKDVP